MKSVLNVFKRMRLFFHVLRQYQRFYQRDFTSPSPNLFKMKTLMHFADSKGAWLETGTYIGTTSEYLAKRFTKVITIEPSDYYFEIASQRLKKYKNVTVLKGTSEELFEESLISVSTRANIWLDGHFSEGRTYLANSVTPIVDELLAISRQKESFESLIVFIDDIRLFPRTEVEKNGYPQFQLLIDWCRDNSFKWELQNDILIAEMMT